MEYNHIKQLTLMFKHIKKEKIEEILKLNSIFSINKILK